MRLFFKADFFFKLIVFAVLLSTLWSAAQPDFGGGHLIALVAGFTAVILAADVIKDHIAKRSGKGTDRIRAEREQAFGSADSFEAVESTAGTWKEGLLACSYTVLLLALVYTLGTLAGCTLFVIAFLLAHKPGNLWLAVTVAVLVGGGLPYLLGDTLGLRLWEGIIPTIIPGWIGGGTPPPL